MQVGSRVFARGRREKLFVPHHTTRSRGGKCRPIEKAVETRTRREGKKAARER